MKKLLFVLVVAVASSACAAPQVSLRSGVVERCDEDGLTGDYGRPTGDDRECRDTNAR